MLKIFFPLLICVLGHSTVLNNVLRRNDVNVNIKVDLCVTTINSPSQLGRVANGPNLYKEASPVNFYNFPGYKQDIMLSRLQNSLLYVLVPVHKSSEYIWDLVNSISKATKELPRGCIVYPIFRIDDDELDKEFDIRSLKKALQDAEILEEGCDISCNPKNIGQDLTRQALLDIMTEIDDEKYKDTNRKRYFTFLDSNDIINKFAFKVFLSAAYLSEDKWVFDFEHCIRRFNEANKQAVVLDTNLSLKDLCCKCYNTELPDNDNAVRPTNFDEHGFLMADMSNIICGYCPALYKYDKIRIISCKRSLTESTLEHFSTAYADRKNLNKLGATPTYHHSRDGVIPAGYFKVFLKGFDNLTGEERGKKGALYYYRDHEKQIPIQESDGRKRARLLLDKDSSDAPRKKVSRP